jgi:putative DNA primase/helicase
LLKKWFVWGNTHWKVDNSKAVEQMAKKSIMRLYNAAADMDSKSQEFDLLLKHIKKSLSNTGLKAMVERAQSEQGIPVDPSDFNKDKMLFNALNCTIDLRTGKTRPHSKEDMINKISPVVYDPDAQAPTWDKFLDQIMAGDKELISFLQRWVGYTLNGETSEQCFVFLYGKGGNGKSRFVMPIQAIMGDYARTITTEALMVRRNGGEAPSPYIARLHGARMVVASETNEGVRLSESLIKQLSGEDVIIARHLHAEPIEFIPEFKLWIYGNHKPKVVGQDEGIWRRVLLIPFEVTIPKEKRDRELLKKLYAELPGILVWAVRGCLEWQRIGLSPPKKVLLATEEYRKENNLVENFIAECCILKDYAKTRSGDLYDVFKKWCVANGETPYSQTKFGTLLSNKGLQGVRGTGGRKWWEGIGLIDEKISVGGTSLHDGAGVREGAKGGFAPVPVVSAGLEDYEKAW